MTPADRDRVLESIERQMRAHLLLHASLGAHYDDVVAMARNVALAAYELGYAAAERSMRGEVDAEGEAEAMARRSVL